MTDAQTHCPLCGGDNACAVAAGLAISECWCQAAILDRVVLAAVPARAAGTVCLCAACARPQPGVSLAR